MKARPWRSAHGVAALLLAGCATATVDFSANAPTRPPADAPERFQWERGGPGEPAAACNSPMADSRTQARLRPVRSAMGRGDYEVPEGRYGVGPGELLRLECGSGRVIGIVER